jgi:ligand-binding SRPBCC domain-containing protein
MKTHLLERKQLIPRKPEEVFPFFENPLNLRRLTPPWLGLRIRSSDPIEMKVGAEISYSLHWLGIPLRWRTVITRYRPPAEFIDTQVNGPYLLWHHTHSFRLEDGGTEMTDVVRYQLPLGLLGSLAHALVVRRQLERIFDYRAVAVSRIFEEQGSTPAVPGPRGNQ